MKFDDTLGDGEPQPGSHGASSGRLFDLPDIFEDDELVLRSYSDAVIGDSILGTSYIQFQEEQVNL
jgi:GTP-sensing pleiotropic transcriptional regulator CodY